MTKKAFGVLPSGEQAYLYTIRCGQMEAAITDFGATLVSLIVPDKAGNLADVVLGFDEVTLMPHRLHSLAQLLDAMPTELQALPFPWENLPTHWKPIITAIISTAAAIPMRFVFGM